MALYANKFTVEINDVARIVFLDERAALEQGPPSSAVATEIVMTPPNLKALGKLIETLISASEKRGGAKPASARPQPPAYKL